MFNNSSIQSNITQLNGNSFGLLVGFGMYSLSGTVYYYVMDWIANKVFIFKDLFLVKTKNKISPSIIIIYSNFRGTNQYLLKYQYLKEKETFKLI